MIKPNTLSPKLLAYKAVKTALLILPKVAEVTIIKGYFVSFITSLSIISSSSAFKGQIIPPLPSTTIIS